MGMKSMVGFFSISVLCTSMLNIFSHPSDQSRKWEGRLQTEIWLTLLVVVCFSFIGIEYWLSSELPFRVHWEFLWFWLSSQLFPLLGIIPICLAEFFLLLQSSVIWENSFENVIWEQYSGVMELPNFV